LVSSISAFLTLFKAVLQLYGEVPPAKKMEVLPLLSKYVKFDEEVFTLVWNIKEGKKQSNISSQQIFGRYLKAVQAVVDAVDLWIQYPDRR